MLIENDEFFKAIYSDDEIFLATKVAHSSVQVINEAFGLKTMKAWEVTPTWYRASLMAHVEQVIYFNRNANSCHSQWIIKMRKLGWVYGEERNNELKTHPLMVPYKDLPVEEKLKLKALRGAVVPFRKPHPPRDESLKEGNSE